MRTLTCSTAWPIQHLRPVWHVIICCAGHTSCRYSEPEECSAKYKQYAIPYCACGRHRLCLYRRFNSSRWWRTVDQLVQPRFTAQNCREWGGCCLWSRPHIIKGCIQWQWHRPGRLPCSQVRCSISHSCCYSSCTSSAAATEDAQSKAACTSCLQWYGQDTYAIQNVLISTRCAGLWCVIVHCKNCTHMWILWRDRTNASGNFPPNQLALLGGCPSFSWRIVVRSKQFCFVI